MARNLVKFLIGVLFGWIMVNICQKADFDLFQSAILTLLLYSLPSIEVKI